MAEQDEQSVEEIYRRRLAVEEFLIDFLGGLVPGILFISAATFALLPPLHALTVTLSTLVLESVQRTSLLEVTITLLQATANTPSALWLMVFVVVALLVYITGHLFYRHDPNLADKSSFRRLMRNPEFDTLDKRRCNLGCEKEEDCEFPYLHMHDYLKQRGLIHLLPFILWRDESRKSYRSKSYINILKIRLRYYHPDKCGTIIRNEAHVRLASSTWYVAKILSWVGCVGVLIAIVSVLLSQSDTKLSGLAMNLSWHSLAILAPLLVLILSVYSWWVIRGFLHYQRMREVIFVLETAYTAFHQNFALLNPPFTELE